MYFCAGYIEHPPWEWPPQSRGHKRAEWRNNNWPPASTSGASASAPAFAPAVVPARVARVPDVVVVPDEDDHDGDGDAVVPENPRKSLRPKFKATPARSRPKPKAMPDCLAPKSKTQAPGVSGVAGVGGAKRKNSRSPSAGRNKVRLVASSATSGSGVSGVASEPIIPLRKPLCLKKPLLGQKFTIYSAGSNQASKKDFQSPS